VRRIGHLWLGVAEHERAWREVRNHALDERDQILWSATDPKLRLGIGGSLVRFGGDKLLLMSDRGKLSIARATPAGIALLSQADVLDAREVWSTPLLYAGRLYAKGDTEFVCFDMTGKAHAAQTQSSPSPGN